MQNRFFQTKPDWRFYGGFGNDLKAPLFPEHYTIGTSAQIAKPQVAIPEKSWEGR
jgi:hypothetical protein